jgi:hypothetical protein
MPGTGYIVKTSGGDRGPYSTDQIREFTTKGKLQPDVHLRDAVRGHSVTVAEVLDGRAKIKAMAVSTSDIAIDDIPGIPSLTPAPAPAPPGTAAIRRTDRQSSARRPQLERAPSSRRAASEPVGSERGQRQPRGRSQPIMLYVAIAIAVVGAVVLTVLAMRAKAPPPSHAGAPSAR